MSPLLLFLISIHIGSEVGQGGSVVFGTNALDFKVIEKIFLELIADGAVQIRRGFDGGDGPHTGQALIIAAGDEVESGRGQPDPGRLDHVDQRPGSEQVMMETADFLHEDVVGKGTVVSEDDVAQLASQGAVKGMVILTEFPIICNDVLELSIDNVGGGKSIRGKGCLPNQIVAIDTNIVGQLRVCHQGDGIRHGEDHGDRIDRSRINAESDQGFQGAGGSLLIIRCLHCLLFLSRRINSDTSLYTRNESSP